MTKEVKDLYAENYKTLIKETEDDSKKWRDFPGGSVVKNPPANAGDTGSILAPERSHMPWSS